MKIALNNKEENKTKIKWNVSFSIFVYFFLQKKSQQFFRKHYFMWIQFKRNWFAKLKSFWLPLLLSLTYVRYVYTEFRMYCPLNLFFFTLFLLYFCQRFLTSRIVLNISWLPLCYTASSMFLHPAEQDLLK